MRSNRSHLGSRHLALEPGRVRYSVVTGKAAGRSTMPGRHGCKECCKGCHLRRCCRHCGPHHPTSDLYPHLCEHCHSLFYDGDMTMQEVEFAVFSILHVHVAKLERAANAAKLERVRALEQKRGK